MATALQNSVSKSLQNQGINPTDALNAAKKAATTAGNLLTAANAVSRAVATAASSVRSASLSSMASSLPATSNLFSSTINNLTSSLTSTASDISKGLREANNKIQSLTSDAASAIANPVAFITKPVTDVIKGIDSLSQGSGLKNYTNGLTSTQLKNLGISSGTTIRNSDDVLKAIISITNNLSANTGGNTNYERALKSYTNSPTTAPTVSTTSSYEASLMKGIRDSLGYSSTTVTSNRTTTTTTSNIISVDSLSITDLLSLLSPSRQSSLQIASSSYLSSQVSSSLDTTGTSYSTIVSLLGDSGISNDTILEKLLNITSLNTNTSYAKYLSSEVNAISLGIGSLSLINSLYSASQNICSEINNRVVSQYNTYKDLYDVLMSLSLDYDMTDLIEQLRDCISDLGETIGISTASTTSRTYTTTASAVSTRSNAVVSPTTSVNTPATTSEGTENTASENENTDTSNDEEIVATPEEPVEEDPIGQPYFDRRTASIFQAHSRDTAIKGSVHTYLTIQQTIDTDMILDLEMDLVYLIGNMPESTGNLDDLNTLLDNVKVTPHDLLYTEDKDIENIEILDAVNVVTMSANGTTVVDTAITEDMRKLAQGAFYAYAGNEQ